MLHKALGTQRAASRGQGGWYSQPELASSSPPSSLKDRHNKNSYTNIKQCKLQATSMIFFACIPAFPPAASQPCDSFRVMWT